MQDRILLNVNKRPGVAKLLSSILKYAYYLINRVSQHVLDRNLAKNISNSQKTKSIADLWSPFSLTKYLKNSNFANLIFSLKEFLSKTCWDTHSPRITMFLKKREKWLKYGCLVAWFIARKPPTYFIEKCPSICPVYKRCNCPRNPFWKIRIFWWMFVLLFRCQLFGSLLTAVEFWVSVWAFPWLLYLKLVSI